MSTVDQAAEPRRQAVPPTAALARVAASPRLWVYLACAAAAVVTSYLLGKEMMWDTLDYHFYAGFSALHDRFGKDYFAAGTQSYLNPYVYVPFFALVRSGLPALCVASILATAQSVILWLTYELGVLVSSSDDSRARIAAGACSALLAFANPILINQLGSSYVDVITAEAVLAGWLLLIHAVRAPRAALVVSSGLLLGLAAGLKLTNSLHALAACVLLLFVPCTWRGRLWLALGFGGALALGFVVVAAPWSMQLEHHFGNPFFPLVNDVFRSPQFSTAPMIDKRFLPSSLWAALWRPFAIAAPVTMVDDEYAAPDLRYALLLVLAILVLARWTWCRLRRVPGSSASGGRDGALRALIALGCAFMLDWVLWLRVAGNGRYFIAMACVAGVLAVSLAFRAVARPKALAYVLAAVFAVQALQLIAGTRYRMPAAWDGGPWLEVSVPRALAGAPDLYLMLGEPSNSFVAPFLATGSGFINLEGDYVLGPGGANGSQIESLIRKYSPHLRVAVIEPVWDRSDAARLPDPVDVEDALAPFGLRADTADCSTITIRDMRPRWRKILVGTLPIRLPNIKGGALRIPESPDGYLVTCRVVEDPGNLTAAALADAERGPNLVFDRVEDACPQLFQPKRPLTEVYGDEHTGYLWVRKYPSTNLVVLIGRGPVRFVDGALGGRPDYLGSESDWEKAPQPLTCGRQGAWYYASAPSVGR